MDRIMIRVRIFFLCVAVKIRNRRREIIRKIKVIIMKLLVIKGR